MNKQLVVLTFAAFGAFMLNASAAGVADLHAAKGQDCAACHMGRQTFELKCLRSFLSKMSWRRACWQSFRNRRQEGRHIHKTHFDTFECLQCHKGHSQSVIACAECHKGAQSIQVP